ncbi:hypothetical protein, partial [Comamonas sp. lk]|uniref:hypothetical protein n=1 Tax=Comamonas sp. lk TaxID=2201272 RepID=UPI0019694C3A
GCLPSNAHAYRLYLVKDPRTKTNLNRLSFFCLLRSAKPFIVAPFSSARGRFLNLLMSSKFCVSLSAALHSTQISHHLTTRE